MLAGCGHCGNGGGNGGQPAACWDGPTSTNRWPPTCWRPYADSAAFNRKIPQTPQLHSQSAQIMERILGKGSNPIPDTNTGLRPGNIEAPVSGNGGEPTHLLGHGDERVYTIKCGEFGPCALNDKQVRSPLSATIEGGWTAPLPDADRHMTVVDWSAKREYDFWHVNGFGLPPGGGDLVVGNGGAADLTGDGRSEVIGSTGTAANTAGLAGRIRIEELAGGYPEGTPAKINHAIAIDIDCHNGTTVEPARGNAPNPGRCAVRGRSKNGCQRAPR